MSKPTSFPTDNLDRDGDEIASPSSKLSNNDVPSNRKSVHKPSHRRRSQIPSASRRGSENANSLHNYVIGERWVIQQLLGAGAFGQICSANHRYLNTPAAIKLELIATSRKVLSLETGIVTALQPSTYVPRYMGHGEDETYNYLIMELLGPDLSRIRKSIPNGKMNICQVLRFGIQMLHCIRSVHELGYIHRDIKPSNFAIGMPPNDKKLYIFDFGLTKTWRLPNGSHRPARPNAGFRGTSRYASIASHKHQDLGRRDDLWSYYYVLIEFLTGSLPWKKYRDKDTILAIKERYSARLLSESVPRGFQVICNYIYTLQYQDVPDYQAILSVLYQMLDYFQNPTPNPPPIAVVARQAEQSSRGSAAKSWNSSTSVSQAGDTSSGLPTFAESNLSQMSDFLNSGPISIRKSLTPSHSSRTSRNSLHSADSAFDQAYRLWVTNKGPQPDSHARSSVDIDRQNSFFDGEPSPRRIRSRRESKPVATLRSPRNRSPRIPAIFNSIDRKRSSSIQVASPRTHFGISSSPSPVAQSAPVQTAQSGPTPSPRKVLSKSNENDRQRKHSLPPAHQHGSLSLQRKSTETSPELRNKPRPSAEISFNLEPKINANHQKNTSLELKQINNPTLTKGPLHNGGPVKSIVRKNISISISRTPPGSAASLSLDPELGHGGQDGATGASKTKSTSDTQDNTETDTSQQQNTGSRRNRLGCSPQCSIL